jgi:hypothetical protein
MRLRVWTGFNWLRVRFIIVLLYKEQVDESLEHLYGHSFHIWGWKLLRAI